VISVPVNQNPASKAAEQAIAKDLDLCDAGTALTTGPLRRKYVQHRRACFRALRQMNKDEGLNKLTDEQLLKSLEEPIQPDTTP
jgi:hypothetical protein